jgi:hypothetical protein
MLSQNTKNVLGVETKDIKKLKWIDIWHIKEKKKWDISYLYIHKFKCDLDR